MAGPTLTITANQRTSALKRLVADFLAHQRACGQSPRTLALTANVLEAQWLPLCSNELMTAPEQFTQQVFDRWSAYPLAIHLTPVGNPLARESVRT